MDGHRLFSDGACEKVANDLWLGDGLVWLSPCLTICQSQLRRNMTQKVTKNAIPKNMKK